MRSIEDKGCLNHGSPQEIHGQKGNGSNRGSQQHRTALGKPTPSKWDDAQKWLVNLSRGVDKKTDARDSNADDRRLIAPAAKKDYPSSEDEEQGVIETKKVDLGDSVSVRDMGTEMTPMGSQEPSRSATPVRATTPMVSGSSTPARGSQNVAAPPPTVAIRVETSGTTRFGRESEGEEVGESHRNVARQLNPLETRALAWDEAERAKYMARFKREEVKIEAWENHEKRKAEMELKRMEGKAERLKSRAQEKYRNKLASTRRVAEEKRAKAEAVLNEKAVKTCERADYIRRTGHLPSSFSSININLPCPCHWCCS